jgi:hypothetical protein
MYRQDESIYALIPPEEMEQQKPPMCARTRARSAFLARVAPRHFVAAAAAAPTSAGAPPPPLRAEPSHPAWYVLSHCRYKSQFQPPAAKKKPYSMMGREVGKPDPQKFMKAGEKTKGQLSQPKPFAREPKPAVDRKAAVPGRDEKPIYGLKTSKNYVTANAVENILQAPKRVPTTDARFTAKEDYGKVPDYLVRIKQERQEEDEFIAHIQQMRAEQTGVKVLPEEVRTVASPPLTLFSRLSPPPPHDSPPFVLPVEGHWRVRSFSPFVSYVYGQGHCRAQRSAGLRGLLGLRGMLCRGL